MEFVWWPNLLILSEMNSVSELSKQVTHLVAGEKAGSKLKKAQEMGVTVVDKQEFLGIVGRG